MCVRFVWLCVRLYECCAQTLVSAAIVRMQSDCRTRGDVAHKRSRTLACAWSHTISAPGVPTRERWMASNSRRLSSCTSCCSRMSPSVHPNAFTSRFVVTDVRSASVISAISRWSSIGIRRAVGANNCDVEKETPTQTKKCVSVLMFLRIVTYIRVCAHIRV